MPKTINNDIISTLSLRSKNVKRALIIIAIAVLSLYVVLPRLKIFGLKGSLTQPAHWSLALAAGGVFLIAFVVSAISYKILAFHHLKFWPLLAIQFGGVPLSLLLPAGLSNISVNFLFVRANKHSEIESGVILGVNNLVGVIANLSLLAIMLVLFGFYPSEKSLYLRNQDWLYVALAAVIVVTVALIVLSRRITRLRNFLRQLINSLKEYRRKPSRLLGAYLCALIQTTSTVTALWLMLSAFGISIYFPAVFLIFSFSVLIGTSLPTPGGLGGVEASLIAGILAAHVTTSTAAVAAVLAYRIMSYWVPLALGVFALIIVQRKKLLKLDNGT